MMGNKAVKLRLLWLPGAMVLAGACAHVSAAAGEAAPPSGVVVSASGRVEPLGEERQLRFAATGCLARLTVEEGQTVKAGQVLAELENSEEKALLAQAEADLARAQALLARSEAGARAEERAVAEGEVALAAAELRRVEAAARGEEKDQAAALVGLRAAETAAARRVAERVRRLREGGHHAASQEELEAAEDGLAIAVAAEKEAGSRLALVAAAARGEDLAVAQARLKLAEARAVLTKASARAEDLAAARAERDAAAARRAAAEARLNRTILKSPVDGTVLKTYLQAGAAAAPVGDVPVMTVGTLSHLMVRAEVDELDVAKVRPGQLVRVEARGYGKQRFTGKVVRISPTMGRKRLFSEDPRERTDTKVMEVLIDLDGKPVLPVGYRIEVYFLGEGGA
jgi:HlyD family secretion protein